MASTTMARSSITQALAELRSGDRSAWDRLFDIVYEELHELARRHAQVGMMQPTVLVHESFLRMVGSRRLWLDRKHFFLVAGVAMRHALVDAARAARRAKRHAQREDVALESLLGEYERGGVDLVDLHDALTNLDARSKRQARIVELHFFAGLDTAAIASILGVSSRTVTSEWRLARAWLRRELSRGCES